jgi:acyl carrier protein
MRDDVDQKIRRFISDNFLFGDESASVANDASLLEAGLIDSTGVLELVGFLESEFNLTVADAEIIPENLDSIQSIAAYVGRKLASSIAA